MVNRIETSIRKASEGGCIAYRVRPSPWIWNYLENLSLHNLKPVNVRLVCYFDIYYEMGLKGDGTMYFEVKVSISHFYSSIQPCHSKRKKELTQESRRGYRLNSWVTWHLTHCTLLVSSRFVKTYYTEWMYIGGVPVNVPEL